MPDDDISGSYDRNERSLYEPSEKELADVDEDCRSFLIMRGLKPSRGTPHLSPENASSLLKEVRDDLEKDEEK